VRKTSLLGLPESWDPGAEDESFPLGTIEGWEIVQTVNAYPVLYTTKYFVYIGRIGRLLDTEARENLDGMSAGFGNENECEVGQIVYVNNPPCTAARIVPA
jgi:hypothetical protein